MVALATSNLYTFELDKLYKKIIKDFRFEQTAMGWNSAMLVIYGNSI